MEFKRSIEIKGKKYRLFPVGFIVRRAAEKTIRSIRKDKRAKGARIIVKRRNGKKIYLIYIR